jgi:hypothetical protein
LLSAKIKAKDFRRLDVIRKLEIITTIRHNNYPAFTLLLAFCRKYQRSGIFSGEHCLISKE